MHIIKDVTKDKYGIITGVVVDGFMPSDIDAIKSKDKFMVVDGEYIAPKFLTYDGQDISCLPVHFESCADMYSNAMGECFIPIDINLCADKGRDKNMSCDLKAGMRIVKINDWVEVMPAEIQERCQLVVSDMDRLHNDIKRHRYKKLGID